MIAWIKLQWKQYICPHPPGHHLKGLGWESCSLCGARWGTPKKPKPAKKEHPMWAEPNFKTKKKDQDDA